MYGHQIKVNGYIGEKHGMNTATNNKVTGGFMNNMPLIFFINFIY